MFMIKMLIYNVILNNLLQNLIMQIFNKYLQAKLI